MTGLAQMLTPRFESLTVNALSKLGFDVNQPRQLAGAVQSLSNFYIENPGRPTPWHQPFSLPATLAYFMPLNFVRMRSVLAELKRFLADGEITEVWDFGSGTGTVHWALEESSVLTPKSFFVHEVSTEARDLHLQLARDFAGLWQPRVAPAGGRPQARGRLAIFSYAFLEMQNALPALEDFDHWLILEPSTRDCGRALMQWRERFISQGIEPLAPCTHSQACPLLTHSPRDWCHMRIPFEGPEWFQRLEDHLPMKNRSLTFCYLLASRTVRDQKWRGSTRVIGDTLEERGKTRQLMCRGPEREFLSWLHKHGKPPRIPHGALIADLGAPEIKASEVRAAHDLEWEI